MFCPVCHDEFRPEFTRCASCDVGLVEDLSHLPEPGSLPPEGDFGPVELVDYCGFVGLSDAREARNTLRRDGIPCEIAIREAPGSGPAGEIREEFWLRVDRSRAAQAREVLGYDLPEPPAGLDETELESEREPGRERF